MRLNKSPKQDPQMKRLPFGSKPLGTARVTKTLKYYDPRIKGDLVIHEGTEFLLIECGVGIVTDMSFNTYMRDAGEKAGIFNGRCFSVSAEDYEMMSTA